MEQTKESFIYYDLSACSFSKAVWDLEQVIFRSSVAK